MIDDVQFLFPNAPVDLCSPEYLNLLARVSRADSWIRYSLLFIGCFFVSLVAFYLIITTVPPVYLRAVHLPALPGRTTPAGWVVVVLFSGIGFGSLYYYHNLRQDVLLYSLPLKVLCRYRLETARVTGFGPWRSFGGRLNRFQRVLWAVEGAGPIEGYTPLIRSRLSIWIDYDDPVIVAIDPAHQYLPIFLGVQKPAPPVLLQPSATAQEIYAEFEKFSRTSHRWKGKLPVQIMSAPHPR
jgi:hypothetical protein